MHAEAPQCRCTLPLETVPCPACGEQEQYEPAAERRDGLTIVRCRCGLAFVNPRPTAEAIPELYANYYSGGQGHPRATSPTRPASRTCGPPAPGVGNSSPTASRYEAHGRSMSGAPTGKWSTGCAAPVPERPELTCCPTASAGGAAGARLRVGTLEDLADDVSVHGAEKKGTGPCFRPTVFRSSGVNWPKNGPVPVRPVNACADDEQFDVVTLMDVIEHIPDLPGFMAKLGKIMKPGGLVMVQTPNFGSYRGPASIHLHNSLEHLLYFEAASLDGLFDRHGYEPVAPAAAYCVIPTELPDQALPPPASGLRAAAKRLPLLGRLIQVKRRFFPLGNRYLEDATKTAGSTIVGIYRAI